MVMKDKLTLIERLENLCEKVLIEISIIEDEFGEIREDFFENIVKKWEKKHDKSKNENKDLKI